MNFFKKHKSIVAWFILFGAMMFATLNIHSRAKEFNYHSEIFSDKAGYYIYLPALFIYNFNTNEFPDSIEHKTGEGFFFDRKLNKIDTKYPCGVAILELPFFFGAHIYSIINNLPANGFTRPYNYAIDVAAVFYLMFGLLFLFKFLANYFEEKIIYTAIFLYLTGTNLFYYAAQETGLSHIYSFFLVSAFLYFYKIYLANSTLKNIILPAIFFGFVVLVRPINIVFFTPLFFIDITSFEDLKLRVINSWKHLILLAIISFLILIPQLVYYQYLYQSSISYSYGNESFIYKFNPQVLKVLFAFENGFLPNNPIQIFMLLGIAYLLFNKINNGIMIASVFVLITYTYSSWWSYKLGCGLGHRGFVDFYPILIIPFAYFLKYVFEIKTKFFQYFIILILLLCVTINMKLIYTYDGCWNGNSPWDFNQFSDLLFKPTN